MEDNVLGGQDFTGGCSELYICLHKSDGVVHACAVCVTGSVIYLFIYYYYYYYFFWGGQTCLNGNIICLDIYVLGQESRTSFEGRTLQEDGPLLEDMVSG